MVSTFTPNIGLEIPARGDDVGTWDTPVGNDFTLTDLVVGGIITIPLNNSNIVLSAAQFKSKAITFNSTLTGSVAITFPSTFIKSYEIYNLCTGSSAFTITLQTTVAGTNVICAPPGIIVDVQADGFTLRYKNFGKVGEYWDYAGSSVPNWVSGCTRAPYLNCDGTAFSSATYPQLANILASTTLPDSRGRSRFALNQTTGRLNSSNSIDGNTRGAAGGSELMQQHNHNVTITDPGHIHGLTFVNTPTVLTAAGGGEGYGGGGSVHTGLSGVMSVNSAVTGITAAASAAGSGNSQNVPPAYVGGLTLIRAE